MDCKDCKKMISQFLDNELAQKQQELMRQHLTDCPECTQSLESMTQIVKLLHGIKENNPPLDFTKKENTRLDKKTFINKIFEGSKNFMANRLPLKIAAVMATLVIVVIVTNQTKTTLRKQDQSTDKPRARVVFNKKELKEAETADSLGDLGRAEFKSIGFEEKSQDNKTSLSNSKLYSDNIPVTKKEGEISAEDIQVRKDQIAASQTMDSFSLVEEMEDKDDYSRVIVELKPGNLILAHQAQSWQLMPHEKNKISNLLDDLITKFKLTHVSKGKVYEFSARFGQLNALIEEIEKLGNLVMQTPFPIVRAEAYTPVRGGFNSLILEEKIQIKLEILE
ncbi:MAG: zf-HC2 domain-containing protein [Candidatus Omnitrophota bacterium]